MYNELAKLNRFFLSHPLGRKSLAKSWLRFAKFQLQSRLWGGTVVCNFVNDSTLTVERGMTGATGNVYVGLHEFNDMALICHLLRHNDLFLNVGANVGSYTILAAKVGQASVIAFEPVRIYGRAIAY